ncbi:hypothetical protein IFM89_038569 [Coptis chinensis]|uniref:Peroxidase n=1 Tax=Coptis chinensis TaxID=261450 RepID=A0A835HHR1_9MAGN|nr:hypothetical protein IFM89_038569 [Coptis chinensis]
MAAVARSFLYVHLFITVALAATTAASLSPTFYDKVCPKALSTIRSGVEMAVQKERRMGASLLRLHFHDCFVNGCDASVLLDDSSTIDSEKNAAPNLNSARGFEVIDKIKSEVDKVCGSPVVSCADILAVAARDSVAALGGPTWKVELGRRDSTTASRTGANNGIPSPFMDLPALINNFRNQGLNERDLVALSGGHTLGFSACGLFRNRIYNEANIDTKFAQDRQARCPNLEKKGLLHSDQALFNGGRVDELVKTYSSDSGAFWSDFAKSMIKMGNIKPLTGKNGQIRSNCRRVA